MSGLGGGVPGPGGCVVCLVRGGVWCVWSGGVCGVSGPGGVVCLVRGGGVWSGGVVCQSGGCLPQCLVGYHPPPCEQNDRQV